MLGRRTLLLSMGAGLGCRLARAQTLMRISTLLEVDPATLVAERVMREAYRRVGVVLEVIVMPGERSLVSANRGDTDGELYRKLGMEKGYPQLLRIPVPLQTYEIVAFTQKADFKPEGWDSLKPYRIGFVKGIKIIEENTLGMRIEPMATMHQAFSMLMLDRVDLVLANRLSGLAIVKTRRYGEVKALMPPFASFPVFHYLNKKHEALVPKLTAVLQEMEKERAIQRIQEDVLTSM